MIMDSKKNGQGTPGPGTCVIYSTCALFYLQCAGRKRLQHERALEVGDDADLVRHARVDKARDRLAKKGRRFMFGTIERVQNMQQSVWGGERPARVKTVLEHHSKRTRLCAYAHHVPRRVCFMYV